MTTKRLPFFVCKATSPFGFMSVFCHRIRKFVTEAISLPIGCGNANISTNIMAGTTSWKHSLMKTVCNPHIAVCTKGRRLTTKRLPFFVCKAGSPFGFLSVFLPPYPKIPYRNQCRCQTVEVMQSFQPNKRNRFEYSIKHA
ncbi:MAG TPA: hypothetical protein IAC95_00330 [Candidatus Fimimonas gallinarum]|uniref:Uncharacterized protein n=1 Tax=Candidatus Fimimonas gallinarum TaxID=2840821 RepID=A0A9D1E2S1_9BACT|nr:hypothetical protein [Candidatus Fimimonas gallinarum]